MKLTTIYHLIISGVGGFFAYWFGGFDAVLITLFSLTILDFITGIGSAFYNKTLNSSLCSKGIVKKVFIYLTVILACVVQRYMGDTIPIRETVIIFYIISEGISNLENIGQVIEYPDKLKEIFSTLGGKQGE